MSKFGTQHFEDVIAHWKSLCEGTTIPKAEAFDLIAVPSALPDITLWDFVAPDNIICRFAGTRVTERTNTEITGLDLKTIMPPQSGPMILDDFKLMFAHPCGMHYVVQSRHVSGKLARLQSVSLPLSVDGNTLGSLLFVNGMLETLGYEDNDAPKNLVVGQKFETRETLDLGWGTPPVTTHSQT